MPFDGLVMAAVSHELKNKLTGARVEKIYQPLKEELVLVLSKPRERYRLLISANAGNARVHITAKSKPNPSNPPLFCMVLRKHLDGGYISEITQPGLERILHLKINTRDELGRPAVKTLIIEIMGKHSNIILVDQNNKILDGIKRYSHAVSRHREVLPGREYISPPEQGKNSPGQLNEERFFALLTAADIDLKLTDILLKTFDGFSPLMCREVVYRCGLPLDMTLNHCGEYELRLLWQHFSEIGSSLEEKKFNPTLVFNRDGTPKDFAAFNLTQFEEHKIQHGEMNQILNDFYTAKDYLQQINSKKQSLLTVVENNINRLQKKLPKYQKSLQQAARGEDYRLYGELLTANMHKLKKGMHKVEVENFYHPEWKKITIELNPQLTPSENVQALFKKYVKSKNTVKAVQQQLSQAEEELQYLEAVEIAIRQSNTIHDLEETENELVSQGYIKPQTANRGRRQDKKQHTKPQPLVFQSTDGFTILVGKNNRQNDYITQRAAQPHDLWLHTKEIPGSHVIIRTEGQKVPAGTLEQAAVLAAFHSKARQSSSVPVDYTYIKHVHKPKGAKPGMVIYENQQTVIIHPDEKLVRKLKQ
ncbi:putative ribosome quality control (RQC) complex YloA/Tae2 family protein [Desulfohalotomaculum tongense]|uniref:Rqc2 family fibronectin-binding protein n=1 Tax=Desulforadius tongensis TaxID=1216062 RepID=UPI00195980DA|nr:NFACT RNA binding domain-containing protein [Desulforadius tongensis]MBM7855726.1 putative ribosome quality control (RQC) complex YloA/Tae2 family protein [Desulforadius tongensis]